MSDSELSLYPWLAKAKCKGADPALFFPDPEDPMYRAKRKTAEKFCDGCPVIIKCAEFAAENGESEGVWGGSSAWSYRTRKENRQYIEKLKLIVEYNELQLQPSSRKNRMRIAAIIKQKASISQSL